MKNSGSNLSISEFNRICKQYGYFRELHRIGRDRAYLSAKRGCFASPYPYHISTRLVTFLFAEKSFNTNLEDL